MKITIATNVESSTEKVWTAWTSPEAIMSWNFASDDWCCPSAQLDLKAGGKFCYRMEAKDGSAGFDFSGDFTKVEEMKRIEFCLGDGRTVEVDFESVGDVVKVTETFEAEDENSAEVQKHGWQSILDNFKKHAEKA